MDPKEQLWIARLKDGNESAYKYLFDRHYAVLCHFAFRYVRDRYLAECLVSDVIFHIWERRSSLHITSSVRSYLVASVRNRCLDYLKSRPTKSGSDLALLKTDSVSDTTPMGMLLEKELESVIIHSIDNLPAKTQEVFRMSRFSDMKYEEIASSLNISTNTVKYHIKAALSALREELEKYLVLLFFLFLF